MAESKRDDQTRPADVFTEAQYRADRAGVIRHAAETGRAKVVDAKGQTQVVIRIPTDELPIAE